MKDCWKKSPCLINASQLSHWLAFSFLNSWSNLIGRNVIRNCLRHEVYCTARLKNDGFCDQFTSRWWLTSFAVRSMTPQDAFLAKLCFSVGQNQSNRWYCKYLIYKVKTLLWTTKKLKKLFLNSLTDQHDLFNGFFNKYVSSIKKWLWIHSRIIMKAPSPFGSKSVLCKKDKADNKTLILALSLKRKGKFYWEFKFLSNLWKY